MCDSPLILKRNRYRSTNSLAVSNFDIVPCGSCPSCLVSKRNDLFPLINTEQIFTNHFAGRTAYITFTYNEDSLPYLRFSVERYSQGKFLNVDYFRGTPNRVNDKYNLSVPIAYYKDVQNFFKTIRKTLKRINPAFELRYIFASEYGTSESHTKRPHYHCLMFLNAPLSEYFINRDFLAFCQKYWHFGFLAKSAQYPLWVNGLCSTPAYYLSKYIVKGSSISTHPHYTRVNTFVNRWRKVFVDFFRDFGYKIGSHRPLAPIVFSFFPLKFKIRKSIRFGHQQLPYIWQTLSRSDSSDFKFSVSSLVKPIRYSNKLIKYYLKHCPSDVLPTAFYNYYRIKCTNQRELLSTISPSLAKYSLRDFLLYNILYNKIPSNDLIYHLTNYPDETFEDTLVFLSNHVAFIELDHYISYSDALNYDFQNSLPQPLLAKFDAIQQSIRNFSESKRYSNLFEYIHYKQ